MLILLSGCGHDEPYAVAEVLPATVPLAGAAPVQLTYSRGLDLSPSWSADGRELLYSFVRRDSAGIPNRCLGILPGSGGSRLAQRCATTRPSLDSLTALMEPAMGPGGQVAWIQTAALRISVPSASTALMVGSVDTRCRSRWRTITIIA